MKYGSEKEIALTILVADSRSQKKTWFPATGISMLSVIHFIIQLYQDSRTKPIIVKDFMSTAK
jgi:hypothetical protein